MLKFGSKKNFKGGAIMNKSQRLVLGKVFNIIDERRSELQKYRFKVYNELEILKLKNIIKKEFGLNDKETELLKHEVV